MTLAHYFSGSLVLPETLAAYRRHGRNSFSTLPVLGSWGALRPDDGLTTTVQNFSAMLDHVLDRHEALASVFGRRHVRKFSRMAKCFLFAQAVRSAVAGVITARKTARRNPETAFFQPGAPGRVRRAELRRND